MVTQMRYRCHPCAGTVQAAPIREGKATRPEWTEHAMITILDHSGDVELPPHPSSPKPKPSK